MQPNDQEQQWQRPNAAQAGAPYATPQPVDTPQPAPVLPVAPEVAPVPAQQPTVPQVVQLAQVDSSQQPSVQPQPAVGVTPSASPDIAEAPEEPSVPNEATSNPDETDSSQEETRDEPVLRWQANEYIQRDRSFIWYVLLGVVTIALTLLAIFVIKSMSFAVLVPVMAIALFVYTRRPPNIVNYVLSKKGLYVNDKLHPFETFKSFSVLSHAGNHSFQLIPRKRFHLGQTVYFSEDIGESIVDMLASRLPMKDDRPDLYDGIISKLKM